MRVVVLCPVLGGPYSPSGGLLQDQPPLSHRPDVVAIIDTSPDVVDMLRITLEYAGYVVVSTFIRDVREGVVNLEAFIQQHQPDVILYDLAPPYEANWRFLQHSKRMPYMADRCFVLTTTNRAHVERLAGPDAQIFEIVGTPYDLNEIVDAVRQAVKANCAP